MQALICSKKNQDNCRYKIGSLKPGQWQTVEFRAVAARIGWGMSGPSLDGDVLDNIKLTFSGDATDRVLLDNVEILE